jgi:hypothetical protein
MMPVTLSALDCWVPSARELKAGDDVAAATRDWETFSSAFGIQASRGPAREGPGWARPVTPRHARKMRIPVD